MQLLELMFSSAPQVILAFSRCFWPPQLFDVVCTDSFIPEFWCTRYPAAPNPSCNPHEASPAPAPPLQSLNSKIQPQHRHHAQSSPAAASSDPQISGPAFNATPEQPTSLQRSASSLSPLLQSSPGPVPDAQAASASKPGSPPGSNDSENDLGNPWEASSGASQQVFGLVGFVCGRRADEASTMGSQAVVAAALQQLDTMYGESCLHGCPFPSVDLSPCANGWALMW